MDWDIYYNFGIDLPLRTGAALVEQRDKKLRGMGKLYEYYGNGSTGGKLGFKFGTSCPSFSLHQLGIGGRYPFSCIICLSGKEMAVDHPVDESWLWKWVGAAFTAATSTLVARRR